MKVSVTVRNPTDAPAVVVTLRQGVQVLDSRTLTANPDGSYTTEWTLAPAGDPTAPAGAVAISGKGKIVVGTVFGATPETAGATRRTEIAYPFRVQGVDHPGARAEPAGGVQAAGRYVAHDGGRVGEDDHRRGHGLLSPVGPRC